MKNKITFLSAPAILICWCLFCIQGCKDPLVNSSSLLLKSDSLNAKQVTLNLTAVTQTQTPIISTGTGVGVLGSIADRNFGTTYGSFYAQCQLTSASIFFGYSPVLDSAVLTLAYGSQYGLCNKPVNVVVYELNQDMLSTVNYYTNSSFSVKIPAIGQIHNFVPDFIDSVYVPALGISQPPSMNITLSKSFGQKILNDSVDLVSDSTFLAFMKGIYVTTSSASTGNGMIYFNLASPLSALNLYYHYSFIPFGQAGYADTVQGEFSLPFTGVTSNHFDNTYTGTPAYAAIHATNPATQTKLFIEGGGGLEGKITFDISALPKNIGINKAELVLSQSAADTQYASPVLLDLLRIDDAGQGQTIDDYGATYFGGVFESDLVNAIYINRYRFVITRYFQRVVQGIYNNNGLYLVINNGATSAERAALTNYSTDKNYKLSLIVTYTKL